MAFRRTLRQRSCGNKKRHRTKKSALKQIQELYLKDPENFRPMSAYICRFCGFYHCGHTSFKYRGDKTRYLMLLGS